MKKQIIKKEPTIVNILREAAKYVSGLQKYELLRLAEIESIIPAKRMEPHIGCEDNAQDHAILVKRYREIGDLRLKGFYELLSWGYSAGGDGLNQACFSGAYVIETQKSYIYVTDPDTKNTRYITAYKPRIMYYRRSYLNTNFKSGTLVSYTKLKKGLKTLVTGSVNCSSLNLEPLSWVKKYYTSTKTVDSYTGARLVDDVKDVTLLTLKDKAIIFHY